MKKILFAAAALIGLASQAQAAHFLIVNGVYYNVADSCDSSGGVVASFDPNLAYYNAFPSFNELVVVDRHGHFVSNGRNVNVEVDGGARVHVGHFGRVVIR